MEFEDFANAPVVADAGAQDIDALVASLNAMGLQWVNSKPGQMKKVRDDQVENTAGGFVFAVSDEVRVRRFLILGVSGGTYYSTEKEMTMDNVKALIDIIKAGKGAMVMREIVEISTSGRAPRQDTVIFALALCAHFSFEFGGDLPVDSKTLYKNYISTLRQRALEVLPKVCRIPTHLFKFCSYSEQISKAMSNSTGWGRAMRTAVAEWYLSTDPAKLVFHVTKYQNREGWSHRDLLRLCHARPTGEELNTVFHYVVKGKRKWVADECEKSDEAVPLKKAYELIDHIHRIKALPEEDTKSAAKMVAEYNLAREVIPTNFLNAPEVWAAMIPKMPMTALIRNLGKISTLKLTDESVPENQEIVKTIVEKITNQENLHKALIHPVQILFALSTYRAGHGFRGSNHWDINKKIVAALDSAFNLSFKNVKKTGKRICLALDVSGSMCSYIMNSALSAREASCAMSSIFLRTEDNVECVGFTHGLMELDFMTKDATLSQMDDAMDELDFGSTDCAQPMLWAAKKDKKFDAFIVFTDNETFYGDVHPFEAMKRYREKSGIKDAKLIVCGMTATDFTIADPSDPGMLDVVGFDAAVPNIVNDFITGSL